LLKIKVISQRPEETERGQRPNANGLIILLKKDA
jgi:hypothetical protein